MGGEGTHTHTVRRKRKSTAKQCSTACCDQRHSQRCARLWSADVPAALADSETGEEGGGKLFTLRGAVQNTHWIWAELAPFRSVSPQNKFMTDRQVMTDGQLMKELATTTLFCWSTVQRGKFQHVTRYNHRNDHTVAWSGHGVPWGGLTFLVPKTHSDRHTAPTLRGWARCALACRTKRVCARHGVVGGLLDVRARYRHLAPHSH